MKKLIQAARVAQFVHEGVKRQGIVAEPVYFHSLRVMNRALQDGMDEDFCAACLLHDCDEDVVFTKNGQYLGMLGSKEGELTLHTKQLVEEVTRPSCSEGGDAEDDLKHFEKASPRGMLLKLYDRLDNLESLASEIRLSPRLWVYVEPDHWSKRLWAKYLEETPKLLTIIRKTIAANAADAALTALLQQRCDEVDALLKRLGSDPPQVGPVAASDGAC